MVLDFRTTDDNFDQRETFSFLPRCTLNGKSVVTVVILVLTNLVTVLWL